MAATSAEEVAEAVKAAIARDERLEIIGAGTKRSLGRPVHATDTLDVSGCKGIVSYEPSELILSARAGTSLGEIEALLAANDQILAFEPPDFGSLFGVSAAQATLGGTVAVNASGPRRFKAGAARDHILGVTAVSGRGEIFKAGGKVVKNVTGYDLPRLLAGSFGTLAVMTEITMKVLPKPETQSTLLLHRLDDNVVFRALGAALRSPWDVSGAAYLAEEQITALRVEGISQSVDDRCTQLRKLLAPFGPVETMESQRSREFWSRVEKVSAFAHSEIVWRLSFPPAESAAAGRKLRETIPGSRTIADWGGSLLWLALPGEDALAEIVRAVAARAGGHAMLFRAPMDHRESIEVMPPLEPSLRALNARVKEQFDPKRVLNPGRMYREI